MKIEKGKKIILDADVIIHFIKGKQIGLLHKIFPKNKLCILNDVYDEVFQGEIRNQVDNLLKFKMVDSLDFSMDFRILKEYAKLKKQYGAGESACMAYCRFHKDVLGSSNLKDIKDYCEEHDIQYLTTMNFLNEAFDIALLSEADCDEFIYEVKSRGSKLPFDTIQEYRDSIT
ncbi:hypothetical protein [Flammeovirga sp. OC4]|uniref:hypothetical protein n=1 Tax=Flammeovirga sp. OC4 TaxID=1382345 RepID=UPI0005C77154|nr:hypothetical protein [Flammeovirga sp. OC4]